VNWQKSCFMTESYLIGAFARETTILRFF